MDNFMISFVLLLGFILASRVISASATKKLEQDKKAALIDLFSGSGIYTLVILVGIIILFFLGMRFHWIDPLLIYIIYIISLLGLIIISSYLSYKKLKTSNFPNSYIHAYILSTSLRILGLVIFIALLEY